MTLEKGTPLRIMHRALRSISVEGLFLMELWGFNCLSHINMLF